MLHLKFERNKTEQNRCIYVACPRALLKRAISNINILLTNYKDKASSSLAHLRPEHEHKLD